MSTTVVRLVRFAVATLVLAGALVAFGTWRERTASPPPAATAAPPAPAPASSPPPDQRAKPAGYDQSCAAAQPWGQQVRAPFVCIDAPATGTSVANGSPFTVRGYAGGSFENNVVVEWRVTRADGSTQAGPPPHIALTYAAPDVGMPGAWQLNLGINETGLPVRVRFTAFFESPKDGARVAEASVEVELR
jgi:hypothetical protein